MYPVHLSPNGAPFPQEVTWRYGHGAGVCPQTGEVIEGIDVTQLTHVDKGHKHATPLVSIGIPITGKSSCGEKNLFQSPFPHKPGRVVVLEEWPLGSLHHTLTLGTHDEEVRKTLKHYQ